MKRFGAGTAIVAIKPYPLQFEVEPSNEDDRRWRTELKLTQLPKNRLVAIKKLSDYYGRLGFVRISRTPFMAGEGYRVANVRSSRCLAAMDIEEMPNLQAAPGGKAGCCRPMNWGIR